MRSEHHPKCLLLVAVALIAALQGLSAQEPPDVGIGIRAGMESGWLRAGFPVHPGLSDGEEFTAGTSRSLMFAGTLRLTDLLSPGFDLTIRGGLEETRQHFTAMPLHPFWTFDSIRSTEVEIEREFVHDGGFTSVQVQVVPEYRLTSRLGVGAGVAAGYRFGLHATQYERVLGPAGYAFSDSGTRRTVATSPRRLQSLMVAPLLSVSWRLPLGEHLSLIADLTTRYDLLPATDDLLRDGPSVGGGLTILFGPAPPSSLVPPAPPRTPLPDLSLPSVVDIASPQRRRLSSTVDLYAVDGQGTRRSIGIVDVDEIQYRTTIRLPELLPFRSLSADAAMSYDLLRREQVDSFSLDSFAIAGGDTIARQLLNMLGLLLRSEHDLHLLIAGSTGPDESPLLAARRQQDVFRYLSEIWGIDTSRLEGRAAVSVAKERRPGVYIGVTSGADVLEARTSVHHVAPPKIRLEPAYQADAGLAGWQLMLGAEGDTIAHYSDRSRDAMMLDLGILYDRLPGDTSRLTATFTVTDSTGQSVSDSAELSLVVHRHPRFVDRHLDLMSGVAIIRIVQSVPANDSAGFDGMAREIERWWGAGASASLLLPENADGMRPVSADRLRHASSRTINVRTIEPDQWRHLTELAGVVDEGQMVIVVIEKGLASSP